MQAQADTPIALANLEQMSPQEREDLIAGIRDRRMKPVLVYEELSLMQAAARKASLEKKWMKQLEMFVRELDRADKATEKLEQRHRNLRLLEMELEQL